MNWANLIPEGIFSAIVTIAVLLLNELFNRDKRKAEVQKLVADAKKSDVETHLQIEEHITTPISANSATAAKTMVETAEALIKDLKETYDRKLKEVTEPLMHRIESLEGTVATQKIIIDRVVEQNTLYLKRLKEFRAGIRLLISTMEQQNMEIPWRPSPIGDEDTQPLPIIRKFIPKESQL